MVGRWVKMMKGSRAYDAVDLFWRFQFLAAGWSQKAKGGN